MKTILFVHHGAGVGGAAINLRDVVERFSESYTVYVLFLKKSEAIDLFKNINCRIVVSQFPIYYFFHMSKWVRWYQVHKICAQLASYLFHYYYVSRKYIKDIEPDIVYLNSSVLLDWSRACSEMKIKNIISIQETISSGYFGLRRLLIARSLEINPDRIIFISKHNRDVFNNYSNVVSKSCVSYNTVNFDVNSGDICAVSKIYDFIYLGGEAYIKGWPYIIKLLALDLKFTILIAGMYSPSVVSRYFNNDDRVTYIGLTYNPLSYIAASRFLLSPFLEPHFSRPITESYFCNTIPVASNLPGIDEQLIDNKTGLLFDLNDESFIKILRIALAMSERDYESMSANGAKFRLIFSKNHNLDQIYNSVKSIV